MVAFLSLWALSCTGLSKADRDLYWNLTKGGVHPLSESLCHVHHVKLELRSVPIVHGMCVEDRIYARARLRLFPNSFLSIASCFCEGSSTTQYKDHLVCPLCREAEERWQERHNRWLLRNFDRLREQLAAFLAEKG